MKHSKDDGYINDIDNVVMITHIIDGSALGGEFTVCGRAIPDSSLDYEGFEHFGEEFEGKMKDCDCVSCKRRVRWFKALK